MSDAKKEACAEFWMKIIQMAGFPKGRKPHPLDVIEMINVNDGDNDELRQKKRMRIISIQARMIEMGISRNGLSADGKLTSDTRRAICNLWRAAGQPLNPDGFWPHNQKRPGC